jgi:hypothetical protein
MRALHRRCMAAGDLVVASGGVSDTEVKELAVIP